jgi:hypothetical protein
MPAITTVSELKSAIQQLEQKQKEEWMLLKHQSLHTFESLKPVNIIKTSFKELVTSPDFKEDVLGTLLSLAIGFLSKKMAVGSTNNPLKQLLGTILQLGVTEIVSKNSDGIKAKLLQLINKFFSKKEEE